MLILRLTQGSSIVNLTAMVSSVKILAIPDVQLRLDAVINLLKCFPSLEKLYIKVTKRPYSYSANDEYFVSEYLCHLRLY